MRGIYATGVMGAPKGIAVSTTKLMSVCLRTIFNVISFLPGWQSLALLLSECIKGYVTIEVFETYFSFL